MKSIILLLISLSSLSSIYCQPFQTIGDYIVHFNLLNANQELILAYNSKKPDSKWLSREIQGTHFVIKGEGKSFIVISRSDRLYGYGMGQDSFYAPQPIDGSLIQNIENPIVSKNEKILLVTDIAAYLFSPLDNKLYHWTNQRIQGDVIQLFNINSYLIVLTTTEVYTLDLNNMWKHFTLANGSHSNTSYRFKNNQLIIDTVSPHSYIFLGDGNWDPH